ncbi:hypothetical protein CXB51_011310 [Gossypium anomalum]|uniref:Histone chaperone domain-containing protein n=1 Tax=Gossypium anomalum TaxID=47600 RepID=A0A8J6D3Q0_9ROSI|nr:hypothetical protein CXB51_011310 [Gossypium anomalum]
MAEEAHGNPAAEKETKEAAAEMGDIESRITTAMRSRVGHFKEQSDSLTFEGVRRLLEKDLGLERFALDVHKRFVKQCLLKWLDDGNDNEGSSGTVEKNVSTTTEGTESPKGRQPKKEIKEPCSEDEKLEESPVLGLLSENKTVKNDNKENKEVSESKIKKAIRNRASYVKANSDAYDILRCNIESLELLCFRKVTMAGLRRLLEEDLKLDKYTLDPYKKFIAEQLDELLKSAEVSAPASEVKKKNLKKNSQSKTSEKVSKKVISASSGSENDEEEDEEEEDDDEGEEDEEEEEEEEEVKPKKKITPKGKIKNSEGLKKRKIPKKEAEMPSKKRSKHAERNSDDDSNEEDSGSVSDDGRSQSSSAKAVKRKETSAPVYGKRVEHLKSVIKSCGMRFLFDQFFYESLNSMKAASQCILITYFIYSVPPSIYKRVKQVPENKREAQLIKELEEVLSKEGLSANPSEKEIKDVRKRKERARELEGIDMSNIVSSSRRRSTTSFVPPPKPKIPDMSDDDESEESDEDDGDDDEDNDDEEAGDDGNSQSEESEEEEDGDSD